MAHRLSQQPGLEVVSNPPTVPEKLVQKYSVNDAAYSAPIPVEELHNNYNAPPLGTGLPQYERNEQKGYPGGWRGGAGAGHAGGYSNLEFGDDPVAKTPEKRICGLKRWIFITLVVAAIVVVAAAVGGGVAASTASKNNKSSSPSSDASTPPTSTPPTSTNGAPTSTTSSPPLLATPGTFAVTKSSPSYQDTYNSITYFFQDINTPDIYMWTYKRGQDWVEIGKLDGLNPPPRANSSIAAVRSPDEETISLFYTAENGTLYDIIGSSTDTDWRMGTLAPRTNYGVLVSKDSGIAALWWGMKDMNGPGYSIRVYYVDSAAAQVRELAFDNNKDPQWFVTDKPLESCSPTAKITVAHLPPNDTSTAQETAHLFYQDKTGNLRHYPGYDGTWSTSNGTYFLSFHMNTKEAC
ncbi:hypothetical protein ABW20_dc0104049 [Dactylellina cionopaga]|nr:hypothetical protein ABW20_dc0104049 [Dactylellina cionopaga]